MQDSIGGNALGGNANETPASPFLQARRSTTKDHPTVKYNLSIPVTFSRLAPAAQQISSAGYHSPLLTMAISMPCRRGGCPCAARNFVPPNPKGTRRFGVAKRLVVTTGKYRSRGPNPIWRCADLHPRVRDTGSTAPQTLRGRQEPTHNRSYPEMHYLGPCSPPSSIRGAGRRAG